MTVPAVPNEAATMPLVSEESPAVPVPPEESYKLADPVPTTESPQPDQAPPQTKRTKPKSDIANLPPLTTDDPPLWRRHLHWLLVLAMIPLAASLISNRETPNLGERINDSLRDASPEVQDQFISAIKSDATIDDLINILPNRRVRGAWLSRTTYAHWGMALAASVLFLVFFMFLASDGSARPMHVLAVGCFTASIGIGFLLIVQTIASFTEGRLIVGRSVLVIVFYIFKFIGFSYSAASDPENGFLLSLVGFTLGVGLCEELVKAVPLFWHRREARGKTWRGLFIWGLASGAGFGIAEGIIYSSRYYNGISGSGSYVVRFLSCVALHAVWTGSVGITLYLRRDMFDKVGNWNDWIGPTLFVIGIPMVLHGLYDTALKRNMNGTALLIALASFAWLAFLSSRLYGTDDQDAKRAMLREYKRRKQLTSN